MNDSEFKKSTRRLEESIDGCKRKIERALEIGYRKSKSKPEIESISNQIFEQLIADPKKMFERGWPIILVNHVEYKILERYNKRLFERLSVLFPNLVKDIPIATPEEEAEYKFWQEKDKEKRKAARTKAKTNPKKSGQQLNLI